ncbi:MAG: alpha/beta hydrolase [Chitinophagales bacterium]|nr:alpha/beta hydrolase [Chitinophagales bacterium]
MERKVISTERFPKLSYTVSGKGYPVILLHGFPLDGKIWDNVVTRISKEYCVIVPDIPGCGSSHFAGEVLSIEDMAKSIKLIADHEKLDKIILAGHSMGGYAALAFAALFPGKLLGIGLVHSFATADSEEKKDQRLKSIELFKKGGREPFIRQMIPTLFSAASRTELTEAIRSITERALLTENKSLIAFYNAMINRPDRTSNLKDSTVPVLWIIGEDDNIAINKNLMQQTSLANVNFVYVYSHCGHMGMIEADEALSNDLMSFAEYCCWRDRTNYVEKG